MDISEHEKTWAAFMTVSKIASLVIGAILTLLTAWLGAGTPFVPTLVMVLLGSLAVAYLFR